MSYVCTWCKEKLTNAEHDEHCPGPPPGTFTACLCGHGLGAGAITPHCQFCKCGTFRPAHEHHGPVFPLPGHVGVGHVAPKLGPEFGAIATRRE